MRGIGGRPYIDLDAYIDTSLIPGVHEELTTAIVENPSFNGLLAPVKFRTFNLYYTDGVLPEKYYNDRPEVIKYWTENKYSVTQAPWFHSGRIITLRLSTSYPMKQFDEFTIWTAAAPLLPKTVAFVKSLPLTDYGRTVAFVSEPNEKTMLHLDNDSQNPHRSTFIWVKTSPDKKFFILDDQTDKKTYIESKTALFNTNDPHGADDSPDYSFGLRIDGVFTPELEQRIGIDTLTEW